VEKFTSIETGRLGVINARDGNPIEVGRVLGKMVDCDLFQDARKFLTNNGERGLQIAIVPPGTYRINTALFAVSVVPTTEVPNNKVGIVTTKDGKPLPKDDIAGKVIESHNSFQDAQKFIDNNGFKGRQEQIIMAGRYFINPYFADVELVDLTDVAIAHAGVVISFVGEDGKDVTGDSFKHGNLVPKGTKGVWAEPLDPGRYPINTYTHKVVSVPTQNVVLNWATGKTESHNLDKNLSTITVRSSDGYTFNLDVSQIIHIPRNDAPKVIARFGSVENLVTQVLEPIIGNYFRNAAQDSDVIDFLKNRQTRQEDAKKRIDEALKEYNVGAVDTLIGDITPPAELMKTLTDRKLAEQRNITYKTEQTAQITRKELEQATAMAATQAQVVAAERTVAIQKFEAEAAIEKARGQAGAKTTNAEADAKVLQLVGNAEGVKILAIGEAEAKVIQQKITSMESGNYAMIRVAEELGKSGVKWVPEVMVGGNSGGQGGGTMLDVLLGTMIKDMVTKSGATAAPKPAQEAHLDKAGKAATAAPKVEAAGKPADEK